MVAEDISVIPRSAEQGVSQNGLYHYVYEFLSNPKLILYAIGGAFLLVGSAIRLTRVSGASAVESFHTYVEDENVKDENQCFSPRRWCHKCKGCWRNLPRNFRNFFIECLLVPNYRKEWGKYNHWDYKSAKRSPETKFQRDQLKFEKRLNQKSLEQSKVSPHPVPHCHADCQRVRINVCGNIFETQLRTLERFPNTLLGNPAKRLPYFNPKSQEYYFDRSRHTFEVILYFYQSGGRLKRPDNIPADMMLDDCTFFQLGDSVIDQYRVEEGLSPQVIKQEVLPQNLLKRKIWLLFDSPESSTQAQIVAFISVMALFLSIGQFCVETLEMFQFRSEKDDSEADKDDEYVDSINLSDPFFFTEAICNSWFIFEYLIRLCCCPIFGRYLKSALNFIDAVAILPFALTLALSGYSNHSGQQSENEDDNGVQAISSLYLLRIVRIVRVFRIFKLSRHSKGLKILGKTLRASLNELVLLIFFIVLAVILFSSAMYFSELDNPETKFTSIPGGFWWAVITITTVGYGDIVPKSAAGKVVGSLCAVAGVLTIALPVPVIVSNFNYFYHQAIDERDLRWININHVPSCPYRPTGYLSSGKSRNYAKSSRGRESKTAYSSDDEFGSLKKDCGESQKARGLLS